MMGDGMLSYNRLSYDKCSFANREQSARWTTRTSNPVPVESTGA
ncbi:hypothetical protein FX985_02080 [Pseudomonas extremaustralis]|uniref:Uncharacterized protein n=1 Tax=Pseudomonas extremaustralis TaxID=359110 RepID=A0A5M9IYZ2_9PSED|nr:hypothetical protein FX985_02080 [Pseudomonas extremaustralis]